MKVSIYTKIFIALLVIGMSTYMYITNTKDEKVTAAYIPIYKTIDETQLDYVDIAYISFANIDKNEIYFSKDKNADEEIKNTIKRLKQEHQKTRFVLGVGGYAVDGFSDASLDENRSEFTDNIINMVKELGLDGVEIDWEYPGYDAWNTQKARDIDTVNFTSLIKELREKLDKLPKKNKNYLLSFAAGTQEWYFTNVEVKKVEPYVDYINVMSYDLTGEWSDTTAYNANLYVDSKGIATNSVDEVMNRYLAHQIDSKKILMGIPAYSYGWKNVHRDKEKQLQGLYTVGYPIDIDKFDISYKSLVSTFMDKQGYKRYYDDKAKAAYLYNGDIFITYEDKQALEAKVKYIQEKNLGGAMVWEYSHDAQDGIMKYLFDHLD
ncbi:glycosyl hydrolase family 18 protein [Paenibacillus sp. SC116]|uniref:glycoside hydrolase family 18 protein n=1 Tax=Paenibacillus sp. SC116 TaxID=2968986 RepID=UPI00215AFF8D|nr:glycosyl hydrolase family 18 protein [Paenibacillus sp. SC116]MCR8842267.1 glycosyl hydrolase family 18 protein [Paenibacillus sp. SC116]